MCVFLPYCLLTFDPFLNFSDFCKVEDFKSLSTPADLGGRWLGWAGRKEQHILYPPQSYRREWRQVALPSVHKQVLHCLICAAEETVHCYFFPLQIVALGVLIDKEKSNVYVKAELKLSFPGKTSEFPFKTKSSFSINTYLREINICARNFQRVQRARLQILALKRCFVIPSSLIYANFHITVWTTYICCGQGGFFSQDDEVLAISCKSTVLLLRHWTQTEPFLIR